MSHSHPHDSLTDSHFWESYWESTPLPATLDLSDPATRSLARAVDSSLERALGSLEGLAIVEVGCAPGRWLAHFHALGMRTAGIEAAPRAAELTRKNLEALGIEAEILQADITAMDPGENEWDSRFDAVISLGLIEHFGDPLPVVRAHSRLAKPGGVVILGVPNFRGINGTLQKRLDQRWLEIHNTAIMSIPALRKLGVFAGLKAVEAFYCGGFDPNLFNWQKRSYLGFAATRIGKFLRRLPVVGSAEGKWLSSYLLAVFRRP